MFDFAEFGDLVKFTRSLAWCAVGVAVLAVMFVAVPSGNSIAQRFFFLFNHQFVPSGVELVATSPLAPFMAQMSISLLLAALVMSPIVLWCASRYFFSALYHREQHVLVVAIGSATVLFFSGVYFAYRILIPITFSLLYSFSVPMGVRSFFSLENFVVSIVGLMGATGVLFLIPIAMAVATYFDIVSPSAWRGYFRRALLVTIIVTAIVTPDGSGLTMVLLTVPMVLLYGIGWLASAIIYHRNQK